jgi:hypothetical protein
MPTVVLGEYFDPEAVEQAGLLSVEMPLLELGTLDLPDPEGIGVETVSGLIGAITELDGAISDVDMTFDVLDGSDFGSSVQVVVIDKYTDDEESVLTERLIGNTFTVATGGRGYQRTTAVAHADGARVDYP